MKKKKVRSQYLEKIAILAGRATQLIPQKGQGRTELTQKFFDELVMANPDATAKSLHKVYKDMNYHAICLMLIAMQAARGECDKPNRKKP